MDEIHDLKMWIQKKEGEPLALSYKLNVGILNVLWSVTCGRYATKYYNKKERYNKPIRIQGSLYPVRIHGSSYIKAIHNVVLPSMQNIVKPKA